MSRRSYIKRGKIFRVQRMINHMFRSVRKFSTRLMYDKFPPLQLNNEGYRMGMCRCEGCLVHYYGITSVKKRNKMKKIAQALSKN